LPTERFIHQSEIDFETFVKSKTESARLENRKTGPSSLISIPVVFHVVYENEYENVSDDVIFELLQIMNEDYRALYEDSIGVNPVFQNRIGDFEIEFCLAQQDPEGFPHPGITRTLTSITQFPYADNEVKYDNLGGKDAWSPDSYLNIWICDLSIIYYSQFPDGNPETDGVVVDFLHTENRTATSAIGHWIGLRHIWGDGDCSVDDFVSDTPLSDNANFSCTGVINSCMNESPDLQDMTQNYMDGTFDCPVGLFTVGQVERGRTVFELDGPRASILESIGCQQSSLSLTNAELIEVHYPTNGTLICDEQSLVTYSIRNFGLEPIVEIVTHTILDGNIIGVHDWDGNLAPGEVVDLSYGPFSIGPGIHELTVLIDEVNDIVDQVTADNSLSIEILQTGTELELTESFDGPSFPPFYFEINNPDFNKSWDLNETVSHSGGNSVYVNCYSYGNTFTYDDLLLPAMNLTGFNNPVLEFYSAYAQYDEDDSDTLEVLISVDCGETFNSITKLYGEDLASAPNTTAEFFPQASEWQLNAIDLTDYADSDGLIVALRCINSFENNLFVDDINIRETNTVGTNQLEFDSAMSLHPNPTNAAFDISLSTNSDLHAEIIIHDLIGKVVLKEDYHVVPGKNRVQMDASQLPAGIYYVNVKTREFSKTEKLVIVE